MSNIKLVFVILHYKNINDTLECISSIKKIKGNYKIVVVDNNSGNIDDNKKIKKEVDNLIVLNDNLGFAKGNNIGIKEAKKYNPEYIAVINNDTIITQKDLIDRIDKIKKEIDFDAIGFKIITKDGDSVNPFPVYKSLKQVDQAIKKSEKMIRIYNSPMKRNLLSLYRKLKYKFVQQTHLKNGEKRQLNVALHGCAIVFSRKYFEKYKDCFYNKTFLYHEEEFLEYRRRKDKLVFLYDPSIEIFHKEGSSLNFNYTDDNYKKLIFREKNIIKSLTLLRSVIKENEHI